MRDGLKKEVRYKQEIPLLMQEYSNQSEFGNSTLICSKVLVWTNILQVMGLSVKAPIHLKCQSQCHLYLIGVLACQDIYDGVNLATKYLFVPKLLCGQASHVGCTYRQKYQITLKVKVKVIYNQSSLACDHTHWSEICHPMQFSSKLIVWTSIK